MNRSCGATDSLVVGRCGRDAGHIGQHRSTGDTFEAYWGDPHAGPPDLQDHVRELEAAVDRLRRRHPRGDEETSALAPGLWCPGCGEPRSDNGAGACRDRTVLDLDAQHPTVRRHRP